jgi:hypothetical protein
MVSKKRTRKTRESASKSKPGTYPFTSKSEVRKLIQTDREFVLQALRIMTRRTQERAAGRAPRAHRWGWGSADAAAGAGALAERLLSGKAAYGDQKKVAELLAKYTVQIAEALRLEAMANDPGLITTAKVYGVAPSRLRTRGT